MIRPILGAAAFLAACGAAVARPPVPVAHPAPSQRLTFDEHKFMRVSEVRPGMRGYALTVFRGTKIERFNVEILGVVSKFNMGEDYILFRALDGPSVTRKLNIAHGMSGSPIYVGGRLLGAISMGIPGTEFPKDPIALATPIEYMFDAWSPDLPKHFSSGAATETSSVLSSQDLQRFGLSNFHPGPMDVPVSVSGMNAEGIERLQSMTGPYHFMVTAGGGMSSPANNPLARGAKLVPGAAVGVSLVQGDVDVTATGTVTYRDGDRVLLFGHPLTDVGPIDAPMTTAYVVDVYPSYQDSIKIGAPIQTVGRIFQDRPFSVGGVIGSAPDMIPLTVDIDDQSLKKKTTFHAQVINHPLLTEQYMTLVADQAIAEVHGEPGDSIATVSLDVDAEELGHIRRTNTFYDAESIDQTAISDLSSLIHLLGSNPFYPLSLKSVRMSVTIQTKHDTAQVDHIFVRQTHFAPGDTVKVGVVMKPYKRDHIVRTVSLRIPPSAQDGSYTISVQGGGTDSSLSGSALGGLIIIRPAGPPSTAVTVRQLVKEFLDKPRNNQLNVRLLLPTRAITIGGEKLSNLPPTLIGALQSTRSSGILTERDEIKVLQDTPYIVTGTQDLVIQVSRPDVTQGAASPAPSAPPASPPPASSSPASTSVSDNSLSDDDDLTSDSPLLLVNPPAGGTTATPAAPHGSDSAADHGSTASTGSTTNPSQTANSSTDAAAPKPVGRLPQTWRQHSFTDFSAGKLEGVSVSSDGTVQPAPGVASLCTIGPGNVWAIAALPSGGLLVGTGDQGVLYKVSPTGAVSVFYRTGELEVTSIAVAPDGTVYAGTIPHGRIYRVTAAGVGKLWYTTAEPYVTALAYSPWQSAVYAGVGGGTGKVYRIASTGAGAVCLTTPEAHVTALALDGAGALYAGTSPGGLVFRMTPDGDAKVYYRIAEDTVSALATSPNGGLYVGSGPRGKVYRVAPDGTDRVLTDQVKAMVMGLATIGDGVVFACAEGSVYRCGPGGAVTALSKHDDEQFISLVSDGAGSLYLGTGVMGSVFKIGGPAQTDPAPRFESSVRDAGDVAQWGTIAWTANSGPSIQVRTRSGDVPVPDASWSDWSAPYADPSGETVTSPPARYLQYDASFTGATSPSAAALQSVTIYYLPRNHPPAIRLTAPTQGDAVSGETTIQWTASDPDRDTLTYDVSYSADNGKTWTPIQGEEHSTPAASAQPAADPTAQMAAQLATHPEIPEAVRAKIVAQSAAIPLTGQPATSATAPSKSASTRDTTLKWDTTKLSDGTYIVRVVASDRPSNPSGWLTATATSGPIEVENTSPNLDIDTPVVGSDRTVTIHGTASAPNVFVKAVQFQVDDGDASAAGADDGLFDSRREPFTITTTPLTTGKHTIAVTEIDAAGNQSKKTVDVVVP